MYYKVAPYLGTLTAFVATLFFVGWEAVVIGVIVVIVVAILTWRDNKTMRTIEKENQERMKNLIENDK